MVPALQFPTRSQPLLTTAQPVLTISQTLLTAIEPVSGGTGARGGVRAGGGGATELAGGGDAEPAMTARDVLFEVGDTPSVRGEEGGVTVLIGSAAGWPGVLEGFRGRGSGRASGANSTQGAGSASSPHPADLPAPHPTTHPVSLRAARSALSPAPHPAPSEGGLLLLPPGSGEGNSIGTEGGIRGAEEGDAMLVLPGGTEAGLPGSTGAAAIRAAVVSPLGEWARRAESHYGL